MKSIAKHVCNYAVLRFQPYPETGEFVNLGVAVHCAETGFMEVKIEHRKHKRITDFFPELDKAPFLAARTAVQAEFERVQHLAAKKTDPELGRRIFREMVRPRESVFRFGEVRTILTDAPAALAQNLFDQYVERHFAKQKAYQEEVMARRYYEALQNMRPDRKFKRNYTISGGLYHVKVPLCSDAFTRNDAPQRIIKPLDLGKDDATEILEHGQLWANRLQLITGMKKMPDKFIFAVHMPSRLHQDLHYAAKEVVASLGQHGGIIVKDDDTDQIVSLAADGWY